MGPILFSVRRVAPPILFLLKAGEFKNSGKYYLQGGRWHKVASDKPAPKGAPTAAHPHAAGHFAPAKHFTDEEWDKLKLPAENVNAPTFNKQLEQLKQHSEAGHVTGILGAGYGSNTYGKKLATVANHLLGLHGSPHKVAPGQKAGEHAAVQHEPEAPKPEPSPGEKAAAAVDWSALTLPDTNTNAGSINKKVAALKSATEAGDAAAVQAIKTGTNTYNLKIEAAKQKVLAALGGAPAHAEPPKVVSVAAKKPASSAQEVPPASKEIIDNLAAGGDWDALSDFAEQNSLQSVKDYVASILAKKPAAPKVASVRIKQPTQTIQVPASLLHNTQPGHNKFWSVSVHGNVLKTVYGKIGTAGQTTEKTFPSEAAAKGAAAKLVIEKKSSGYKSAPFDQAYGFTHTYSVEASYPDDGPQDGDTKEGVDGTLVFKDGRWHKVADLAAAAASAPADPVEAIALPDFGDSVWGQNYKKVAEALKAAVLESGKDGLKGKIIVHKAGYKAGHFTIKAAGYKLQNVGPGQPGQNGPLREKMHAFVGELMAAAATKKGTKKSAKPAVVSVTATPAPTAAPGTPINIDGWKKVGGKMGSNPGGVFEAPDGAQYYVKFPADPDHAKNEVLAAKLYALADVDGPVSQLAVRDGKIGIASMMDSSLKHDAGALSAGGVHNVKTGFAADAWLANYDVAGLSFDNVMMTPAGHAVRIDVGAGMEYRAQGKKKEFGPKVTETKTLLDPKVNPQAAVMFAGITPADITAGVAKIAAIDDATLRATVMKYGPGDAANRKKLADTLIARKADLLAQYPAAAKAVKARLDPTKLTVDESKLPKPHDFANWNGPGKGLSSKAHVNEANAAVEKEMFEVAKQGHLPNLQEFHYHPLDKETGLPTGVALPIANHPSKHVVQYHEDLVQVLREIAHPPRPLKIFNTTDAATLEALDTAFPPKPLGTTVGKVKSNEKLGFWVVLGGVTSIAKIKPKKDMEFTSAAISAAHAKYHEAPPLAKHFISSVQASGSYNDLFRSGKTHDSSGNFLVDVAKAALAYSTTQPEGTTIWRWQQMTDAMVQKVLSAPDGTVIQATGPMCTSYSPTATQHFGKHRVVIRYAQGARAVESFGSGHYQGEKEVTTLPNARFVVLSKHMVKSGSGQRLELELLMLPPDIGVPST